MGWNFTTNNNKLGRKMKTIEETHPSLKLSETMTNDGIYYYILESDVQKHTIDKAILKEVLENKAIEYQEEITSKHSNNEEKTINNIRLKVIEDIIKELGFKE